MNEYINNELKKRYANISFILTVLLQFFCYRYIKYSEIILIFSTLMFFVCFLIITESVDLIFKNIDIIENIWQLIFAISSIVIFICTCLIYFCDGKNDKLTLIIFFASCIICVVVSMNSVD